MRASERLLLYAIVPTAARLRAGHTGELGTTDRKADSTLLRTHTRADFLIGTSPTTALLHDSYTSTSFARHPPGSVAPRPLRSASLPGTSQPVTTSIPMEAECRLPADTEQIGRLRCLGV